MKRCPITYQEIPFTDTYSREGLRLLSLKLTQLAPLAYSAEEQRLEAMKRASKMSIQGEQPKLSARLDVKNGRFKVVDSMGTYVLKPQHAHYLALPENEDLTMRLAEAVGIECPVHGLIWSRDETLTYFIKRFDRYGRMKKRAQEDFAQLTGRTRETKYDSSIEQVVAVIERHCTFPMVEKRRLFKLLIFSFLAGNEDLHLKNFSLQSIDQKVVLSPAYDLINTTLALPGAVEESALPLKGKKRNLTKNDFVKYLAQERLQLPEKVVQEDLQRFREIIPEWEELIGRSFLSESGKMRYREILAARAAIVLG